MQAVAATTSLKRWVESVFFLQVAGTSMATHTLRR